MHRPLHNVRRYKTVFILRKNVNICCLKFLSYVACRKFAATQKLVEKTLEGVTVFSQKEEARREKFKRRLDEQEAKFKEEQASMQHPTTQTN